MNPQTRTDVIALIESLERQIKLLENLLTHQSEIDACKKAIDRLKSRLDDTSLT